MATSPNYGWSEPDNTSLVKDGAQAIRTLGDAVDTSVWNIGYGQAGKNKIINADFTVNQRSFISTTLANTYGFDRWLCAIVDGTTTYSAQTFTAGAAPVAGYEATNFARVATTGQTLTSAQSILQQKIENVRTFANQTMTLSFWAKAASGTPKVAVEVNQNFGSGGSATVTNYLGQVTLSTSWARYSVTVNPLPSISGKTIGTSSFVGLNLWVSAGSDFNARTGSLGIQTNTFDFWGVQAEYGLYPTPFQTASGGSLQGELAMCQRYYFRLDPLAANQRLGVGFADATTIADVMIPFPVQMRTRPTALEQSGTATDYQIRFTAAASVTCSVVPAYSTATANGSNVVFTVASGLTGGQALAARAVNTNGYLGWSAEL
jgi:hypothetical protein